LQSTTILQFSRNTLTFSSRQERATIKTEIKFTRKEEHMKQKIRIGFVGCGQFAKHFIPLFKAHPYAEKVYVCDLIAEKAKEYSEKFGVDIIDTFEEAIDMCLEAIERQLEKKKGKK
jgi:predicted homoserine dehydrogenase-like protein